MQKVYVIGSSEYEDQKRIELNKDLTEGWTVKSQTPMEAGGESKSAYIFVVIEKKE